MVGFQWKLTEILFKIIKIIKKIATNFKMNFFDELWIFICLEFPPLRKEIKRTYLNFQNFRNLPLSSPSQVVQSATFSTYKKTKNIFIYSFLNFLPIINPQKMSKIIFKEANFSYTSSANDSDELRCEINEKFVSIEIKCLFVYD